MFTEKDHVSWITKILKDSKQPLPNLLTKISEITSGNENQGNKLEVICREMLQLVKKCSTLEDFQMDRLMECRNSNSLPGSWIHLISAISKNITFSDTQHFYNLGK